MNDSAILFGLCGATLVGIGFYGFIIHANVLRRLLAFNVIGSGIFLMLGAAGSRATTDGKRSGSPCPDHHQDRRGAGCDGAWRRAAGGLQPRQWKPATARGPEVPMK